MPDQKTAVNEAVDSTVDIPETTATSKREQVKALIEEGKYTKKEIADLLEAKTGNVSSQMTYLRWQGNFIVTDPETKVLRFVTAEEFAAYEAEQKTTRKTKASTAAKTPQERANALVGTLTKQRAALAKIVAKLTQINKDLELEPEDEELLYMRKLTDAEVTIMEHKIKQNEALAETLPAPEVDENDKVDSTDEDDADNSTDEDDADNGVEEDEDEDEDEVEDEATESGDLL